MMMGDYSGPAASNGGLCINSGGNVSLSAGSNSTTPGTCNSGGAGPGAGGGAGVPKHSTVVERLRQRIEGCRRHHSACEARFQQAHAEQLELERRETAALYQRTLEHRAKKGKQQQQQQGKQQDQSESSEQRNNTLIAVSVLHILPLLSLCCYEKCASSGRWRFCVSDASWSVAALFSSLAPCPQPTVSCPVSLPHVSALCLCPVSLARVLSPVPLAPCLCLVSLPCVLSPVSLALCLLPCVVSPVSLAPVSLFC
ncbi:mastermind-like protein 3 [Clarias gariepinus]